MSSFKKHAIASIGLVLSVAAVNALAYTGQNLAGETKITIEQARAIALKTYPGKITDEELEKEKGGSNLRYSFDIKNGKVTQEVGIDAKTGKLLENAPEGPNPD
ncbi:PepSY domain-containing protein [Glaciimonas immobilis]|uniref:Putative membrane protein YkoI n=1 Tax=Glaciimonas immobilis TaxID=728004 RepID=A0A840S0C4_9BURK|nr:PepSY domain-containing protein [Glaciimonas immobilis]KAF3996344.1 peptidase M4 [Glaciimonas immobilis]MBB5202181.1 putative membrane protein YkoI [Glaciimonas immobilis]